MKSGRVRTLKSAKYLEKKKKKFLTKLSVYFLSAILSMILILSLTNLSILQVKDVSVEGLSTIDQQEIKEMAKTRLSGVYVYFIPKSFFVFYPKNSISNDLIEKYKKIKDIRIKLVGLSKIEIMISERNPDVLVCNGFRDKENDDCFFSDSNAYVYEKFPTTITDFSSTTYFTYYVNSNQNQVAIGNNFVSVDKFIELQKFVSDIASSGIKSKAILINDGGSYELYMDNFDQTTAVVYFDDRVSIKKTTSDFLVFWDNVLSRKIGIKALPNFEYINLRFGNNVFYLLSDTTKQNETTIKN